MFLPPSTYAPHNAFDHLDDILTATACGHKVHFDCARSWWEHCSYKQRQRCTYCTQITTYTGQRLAEAERLRVRIRMKVMFRYHIGPLMGFTSGLIIGAIIGRIAKHMGPPWLNFVRVLCFLVLAFLITDRKKKTLGSVDITSFTGA
jgi:hypothetical protein